MSVFLKQIEIINFKSYKGHVLVGPFRQFSAVIGPNGTGKSNFVDAISFVMGEKAFNLRVKNLGELIYGASLGLPDSPNQCTSVTAVFILARDETKSFTRSIKNSASVYQINETVVANTEYLEELKRIGINLKARNTLVPQGTIECIAMKDPKDLTALLEEISNSKELKPEYDSTWSKASEIENEGQLLLEKRRVFAAHKKAIVQQVEEFETYERLEEEYIEKQLTFYLFRLYYNEKDIKQLKSDKSEKRYELSKLEEKEREANEQLLKQKREFGKLVRELAKLEQDVREQEVEMSKKRSKFTERMQQKAYLQEKLESAQKSLEKARLEHEAHKEAIKELQNQLQEIERAKADYESSIETLSQSQGIDIQLMDEQLQEYRRLKARVGQQLTRYFQICDTLNREQKSMQDKLDNEIRKKTETEIKYQQKVHARDECIDRAKRLAEHINTLETNLKEQRALHEELERDIATSDEKIRQSQEQLENIFQQLNKAKANKDDMSRLKTKAEIIERLKNLYSGVYDRMHNLCQPFHSRYKIAVTKVFGKFIDAIVVDSERTATQCIKYLKEQLYCPETFLPLSNLLVESLKERLREIEEPRNVKLLYDVIQFTPSDVGRAVLFVTKNTLVCETPEDARKVAYEMDGNNVYDCVALDGTFFKKSGLISGGKIIAENKGLFESIQEEG
ncbi:structural maintenance of chromosomes protein 1A [Orussus abietinus]|uniref:structural maintenance of chromosomes protein 1A n=1 Tax=Orussus abietinus TaxID=222816 RepID=UPI000C715D21|nr:structural maintenance of chromosomes protein 1A [Orussus abietinus]